MPRRLRRWREAFWSGAIAVGDKSWLTELSARDRLKGAKLSVAETSDGNINFLTGKS